MGSLVLKSEFFVDSDMVLSPLKGGLSLFWKNALTDNVLKFCWRWSRAVRMESIRLSFNY